MIYPNWGLRRTKPNTAMKNHSLFISCPGWITAILSHNPTVTLLNLVIYILTFTVFMMKKGKCWWFSHIRLFATRWAIACQAPLSKEFSRQEYWSGLPFPSPGDLPDSEIKPVSLKSPALAGRFFTNSATWEALIRPIVVIIHAIGLNICVIVHWLENNKLMIASIISNSDLADCVKNI